MNRIYILGEVLSISEVHFDYYNKLKVYFKFSVSDMCGNVFECIVLEKRRKSEESLEDTFCVVNMKKANEKFVFVICSAENGQYIVYDMY